MANYSCDACEELRQTSTNFVVNGITDTECTSLQNDTGINPSSGNDDCTDLNNINDCLVGNMAEEVEAYDVCDWKTFMKKFIPNLWTTFKGIICAICGIWTNIHNLWEQLKKLQCQVAYLFSGASFSFGEYSTDTTSYIVAGKGVSFLNVSATGTSSDLLLRYVSGGLATLSGSCKLYTSSFTDGAACYNYDNNGVNPTKSASRSGNSEWNATDSKPGDGGQLVYEIRVKMSEFPQIASFFPGVALNTNGGGYHASIRTFGAGVYAFGQHGACDVNNGNPVSSGMDRGHLVPSGWTYIQMRITWIDDLNGSSSGTQYSPYGLLGIRMKQSAIEC